jgi:aspartyl protease family protein
MVMRKVTRWVLFFILFSTAPALLAEDANSLRSLLAAQGYGGAALQRRLGNHMFVSTVINGHRTALLIDTGAPFTIIDRDSVKTLGLAVQKTDATVGGVFGWTHDRFGLSKIATLTMGNCTLANVPVTTADTNDLNYYSRLPHIDGLLGAYEMVKFGAVIDCARQMIYISPHGENAATSQKLAAFLTSRGFTRIPLHFTSNHHFDVEASVNGHPIRLVVDTGAGNTLISQEDAIKAGVVPSPLPLRSESDGRSMKINGGIARELSVGDFKINNAEIELANIQRKFWSGLLGEEYLTFNFGIIDVGGMSLYLRHPDAH